MTPAWSVQIDGLVKRFPGRTVLDGVSLQIPAGQTTALIGPSGGGKSTLLRCVNGLTPFDAGTIQVGPHRIVAREDARHSENISAIRRRFGMIFQDFQLFPHLTAMENIVESPIRVLGVRPAEARSRAMALLDRVGLADRANSYPRELSGGQKQRVAIARAMAMEPRGLLCDEITSALDPELKHDVLDVLDDLRRDGLTLLLVTHELQFARRSADRILVLDDGKVIEEGTPQEVFDHPRTERTQKFLSKVM
jgi:ABC-type polar amino acid transport system ATPase subunit